MATRTVVTMISDLSQDPAAETVQFGLDGEKYEIDLTEEEALELRVRLKVFVDHARKIHARRASKSTSNGDATAIRAWARDNGIEVSDRGRLPLDLVSKYEAAKV